MHALLLLMGATITVDGGGSGDAATIGGGIALAVDGDTVEVLAGTYEEDVDFAGKTIAVEGAGPDVTTIRGTGADSVVHVDSGEGNGTRLAGFTITGGAGVYGGGLYVAGVPLAVEDVTLLANTSQAGGGAMFWEADGVSLVDVDVRENVSTGSAGGLYSWGGSISIAGGTIEGNAAHDSGGGLCYVDATEVSVTDVAFGENTAGAAGGHLYGKGAELACTRCTFAAGTASEGGAVYAANTSMTFTASTFAGNVATGNGGAVEVYGEGLLTLASTTLTGNAASYGGAVVLFEGASLDGAWLYVADNVASGGGGGVYASGSSVTLNNAVISGNVAGTSNGGGLALAESDAEVTAAVFAANSGYSGGAVHVSDGASATLVNLTLTENASSASAGGVRVAAGGALAMTNTIVAWSSEGSGISVATGGEATVRYGDLWQNEGGATSDTYTDPTGSDGNLAVDPDFALFAADGVYADDLRPNAGSPVVDAGDPSILDADGSVSDIGAFAGARGGTWEDGDFDGDGATTADDCDDTDASVHPGAVEACDGQDDDCDGAIDEDCSPGDTGDTGEGDADTDADSDADADADADADTDTDADSDADADADMGDTGSDKAVDEGGCGCSTGGGAPGGLVLVALLAVRRRRG